MLLIAVQAPFADILPTYAAPTFPQQDDLPAPVQTLNATFDDRIKLIGVVPSQHVDADGRLSFTIYWQCLMSMRENYSVFVSVKGRSLNEVGKLDAYPHRGLFATSDCPPNVVLADRYRIPIDSAAQRPTILRVQIGLVDWSIGKPAAITDGAGNPIPSLFFEAGSLPSKASHPPPETRTAFDFGGVIQLTGYGVVANQDAPGHIEVTLQWIARQQPLDDYTLFVHLLDEQDRIIAQWDSQPLDGDYPTSWWEPGEAVLDRRVLTLPADLLAGDYRLALGLYRAPDGPRLPVRDANNVPLPDDRVLINVSVSR